MMRTGTRCAALLLVLTGASTGRAAWVTYQNDASHTGYVPGQFDAAHAQLLWQKPVANSAIAGFAVGDGTVFATNQGYFSTFATFNAVDQATGTTLWSKTFGSNNDSTSAPAYANGNVYFQTDGHSAGSGNFLHAYAARTGASVFDAPYSAQWETYLNPTPWNGSIYVGGGYYGGMYGFNGTNGAQKWFGTVPQYDGWTPAVDGTYAYAFTGSGDTTPIRGVLTMLNLATGGTAATVVDPVYDWNGYTMRSAVVLGTHHDAFGVNGSRLIAWDTTLDSTHTPHIAWSKTLTGTAGQPALANGTLYTTSANAVTALDEITGDTLWSWTPAGQTPTGPVIVTDNLLFAETATATYAIDLATHAPVWSYPATGTLALSDNTLFIGTSSGQVDAIAVPEPASATAALVCAAACAAPSLARRRRPRQRQ